MLTLISKQALVMQLKEFANAILAFISVNIALVGERGKVKINAYSDDVTRIKYINLYNILNMILKYCVS